jgi:hypothetical protein
MGALDEANRLKAERRAEIAAAEVARLREREESQLRSAERLDVELSRFLAEVGCAWLRECLTAVTGFGDGPWAVVAFDVPGHRRFSYRFRHIAGDREWMAGGEFDSSNWHWRAEFEPGRSDYCADLAHALIAAEIEGWTPPTAARAEWPITAEVEHAARAAWAAMLSPVGQTHEPLPPLQALDMVQDEAGERPLAVLAIHYAAALWLDSWRPEEAAGDRGADGVKHGHHSANFMAATACRAHLLGTPAYELAEKCRAEVQERSLDVTREYESEGEDSRYGIDEYQLAINWHTWAQSARLAIDLCRAVTEAAEPKPAPSTPATPPGPPNPPRPPDRREVA